MMCATERTSLFIRTLLLMICCALFMPHTGHAVQKNETDATRLASMTFAVTGISNPVSQLKTLGNADGTSLRSPGKHRQHSLSGPDGDAPAALPPFPALPGTSFLCAQEFFSARALPPVSHGRIHWRALAPPSSRII